MASIAMLLEGPAMNALAFSGSNYRFSVFHSSDANEERKRHDIAVEQQQAAQAACSKQRTVRVDWINEELRHQNHAVQTFHGVNMAMCEYARVFGHSPNPLGPEPQLSDFYTQSKDQKYREIAFVTVGMAATGLVAYKLTM